MNVSGLKHRITLVNSTLPAPFLTDPGSLSLVVNLNAPDVSLATYVIDTVAMWSFPEPNKTEMRGSNVSVLVSKPDLYLGSSDITFSNSTPIEGDSITINAGVHNSGGEVGSFRVEFLIDNISQANKTLSIGANTTGIVVFNWTSTKGTHSIDVIVD